MKVRHDDNSRSHHPDKPRTRRAPRVAVTVPSTTSPTRHCAPRDYFVTANLCFLSPAPPPPSGDHQNVLRACHVVSVLRVRLFRSLASACARNHAVFVPFLSDLFLPARYPLGPCVLLQMARCHSFLWPSPLSIYMWHFFIHSSFDGTQVAFKSLLP